MSVVIESLVGPINGSNLLFTTLRDYKPASVQLFHNGLMGLEPLVDGWIELGGKQIRFKEAPRAGDVLQALYQPI